MRDRPEWMTRPFRAGAYDFVVACSSPELRDVVTEVFGDFPEPAPQSGSEPELIGLSESPGPLWTLAPPIDVRVKTLPAALAVLASEINLGALRCSPELLHLHASGAVRDGRCVVMPAPRESGKTTTLARLVLSGWRPISDEMVAIGAAGDVVSGFAKPLSMKPGSSTLLPELRPRLLPRSGDPTTDILHVPLGSLGPSPVSSGVPHLVTFLRRGEVGGGAQAQPVHPVDAVVRLMAETLDAERFGPDAVLGLANLAARSRCYDLRLGDPEETVATLGHLFDQGPPRLVVRDLGTGPGRTGPSVRSVEIDDRVVVHHLESGRILALDPSGSAIWRTLAEGSDGWDVDPDSAVVRRFTSQLAALELVRDDSVERS